MPTTICAYLIPFLFTVLTIASKNFASTEQLTAFVYEHCELSTHQTVNTGRVGVRKMSVNNMSIYTLTFYTTRCSNSVT